MGQHYHAGKIGALTRRLVLAAALLGGTAAPSAAPAATDARYVSPSGAFSISMNAMHDRLFHANKETVSGDIVVDDFTIMNYLGLDFQWDRTIEWVKVGQAVDPLQMDRQATALVEGYLDGRYGAGKVVIVDRGKFRDAAGRLIYVFSGKGYLNRMSAVWQGAVLFFDNGVALVSEIEAESAQNRLDSKNGVVNPSLIDWAETLRPGQ